jgi:hypothetical protein
MVDSHVILRQEAIAHGQNVNAARHHICGTDIASFLTFVHFLHLIQSSDCRIRSFDMSNDDTPAPRLRLTLFAPPASRPPASGGLGRTRWLAPVAAVLC